MDTIKLKKVDLLKRVKQNRKDHEEVYNEALANYHKDVIAGLERILAAAKAGTRYETSVSLIRPLSYTQEYDNLIAMLEMSVDKEIELADHQFKSYVLDQWGWKQNFIASNSSYYNGSAEKLSYSKAL